MGLENGNESNRKSDLQTMNLVLIQLAKRVSICE